MLLKQLRLCANTGSIIIKENVAMQKQWKVEMRYPGDKIDSLITTDRFDDFADVERKIKQNREMVFVVEPPSAPSKNHLRLLEELKQSGLKITL
jgi:hypothetical protein